MSKSNPKETTMQITTSQCRVIDLEVLTFALNAGTGIAQVQVTITEGQDGNVFLNLFHAPADAPERYSLLATQLAPSGVEAFEMVTSPEYDLAISHYEVSQAFAEFFPTTDEPQDLPF